MSKFKVVGRKLTQTGKVLFNLSYTVETNVGTEKAPKMEEVEKTANAVLSKQQLETLMLFGAVPAVGADVVGEFSVDSRDGSVSSDWVEISI